MLRQPMKQHLRLVSHHLANHEVDVHHEEAYARSSTNRPPWQQSCSGSESLH
jgi:hypothetical protein